MPVGFLRAAEVAYKALEGDAAITDKVRFLSDPLNYPGQETQVEIMETHFSFVFLTGAHAYKLKKPTRGEGFDFGSVEARLRNGSAEIRLNRQLAPKIYLGVIALTRERDCRLKLGGEGRPIDWLVKMVRLDAGRRLDKRLADADWHYAELEALAQRLAQFFAGAGRATLGAPAQSAQIRAELRRARAAIQRVGEPRLRSVATPVMRSLDAFVLRRASLFRQRIAERRLIDGHGDLRPEHIYLKGTPQIIDCLEFRADLRQLDPVSEIAFLALECGRLGTLPIAHRLMRRYCQRTGDNPPAALVIFYTALNAVVRARLAVEHSAEPGNRTRAEWIDRAASYLTAARNQRLSANLDRRALQPGRCRLRRAAGQSG